MENGCVGQGAKPKSPVSKGFDVKDEQDNSKEFGANNWYGKLKGMSNSLKKLTQSKKKIPTQSGQGLGRVLSFNSSKSVDHGSSDSRKELAATNLIDKGLGYNSVDLSCGISRGLNMTSTGVLAKRRNKSLELPRDVSKVEISPFFSKSKIPIVKSNFPKESKVDPDDSPGGGHEYQRLALNSDSEGDPATDEHPASTSLEYESSLANLMLMEQLGAGSETIVDAVSKQENNNHQVAGDMNGTPPTASVLAKPEAPMERLDAIISGPTSAGTKEEVGGAGQKSLVKTSSSGGTTGWPLRRVAGVGSGPLLSKGRKKGGGVDKKGNSVAVETANAGIKGEGAPIGKKNINSMSGELFILKSSKKSSVDPVVPARKSVSDILSRKSVSSDPAKKQHVQSVRPLSSKKFSTGTFSDLGPRKPPARVISKKPPADTPPGRKSVDLGRDFEGRKFQHGNPQDLSSQLALIDSRDLSPASALSNDQENSVNTVRFPRAIHRSGPAAQDIHGQLQADTGASFGAAGSANQENVNGAVKDREEDVLMVHSEGIVDEGRSPVSSPGVADANGIGSLTDRSDSMDTRKSVQDLIRELERNAAALSGSGKSQKLSIAPPNSKDKIAGEKVVERSPDDGLPKTFVDCHSEVETASECKSSKTGDHMEVRNDNVNSASSTGYEEIDLNNVSLSMFSSSASVTTEKQNGARKAELSESFEELPHKLKIDLDPRVVQDIHRTFNLGLVQAVAAASASESAVSRSKPNAEVAAAADPNRFRANQFLGDGNRRRKSVAPPQTLGAAAYTNTIIEGLGGPAGTTTKPSAMGKASADLENVEVGSLAVENSSANTISHIVPAGFVGDDHVSTEDNSRQPQGEADADRCEGDQKAHLLDEVQNHVEISRSSVESSEVRILSSTSSNKMLTSENFHRVAARLAGQSEHALPRAKLPHHVVMPRSSIGSEEMSSTSSNRMLSTKNFHRIAAFLNEYSADKKTGLISQPRPAGGLDSSSSSFNRLEPMLDDFETAESASEADRTTITKEVVPDSAHSRMTASADPGTISSLYSVNTPPSNISNDSHSARSRGRRPIPSRYRNVDYSPNMQSKLGQKDQVSGSNLSSAGRSLDLQFNSQLSSDPYYRKPKHTKYGAPYSSSCTSVQVDRNHPKRGRARSSSANSIPRESTHGRRRGQGRVSDPDPVSNQGSDSEHNPGVVSEAVSDVCRPNDIDSPKVRVVQHDHLTGRQVVLRQKHHLSRPEYIDETNDNSSVWFDNGRMSEVGLSRAGTRLKNSGLRPHQNLSYNGDSRTTKGPRRSLGPNFSGPLIYAKPQDEGLPSEGEDSLEGQWPKSGPIIPASVLREIYDDRDISDDQDVVVDRTAFSAGAVTGARDRPRNQNSSGALYFSGPLISQTIRNSKLPDSGPPSSFSTNLFERVSEGKLSRSASARVRETEGMDTLENGDDVAPDEGLHESYDEHQHEYLIQDHDQLYDYLDQYSDQHTFLDQYIADQLHELSLQQDLHEILSDQLEKVQAASAATAAGLNDFSFNSRGDSEMGSDEELQQRKYEVHGNDEVVSACYDLDAQEETHREDKDMHSECGTGQPHEKVLNPGRTALEPRSDTKDDHLAIGDIELKPEWPEESPNAPAARWYKRSSSSKSLAASMLDVHQDSLKLQRSTISSRAKSKQYNRKDSGSRGGYDSDRNGDDQSGRQRFQLNREFMNTSIQSEPGGIRGLLSKSRGTNSAHSSPARRPSSSRDHTTRNYGGDPWMQPDSPHPSSLVATGKSSFESPLANSRTSFPSLYLMQVSSSTYQPAPPRTRSSTVNHHLQPPSRNLLTQNIATISIEDFTSSRHSYPSARTGLTKGGRAKNASQMKGHPVDSQKPSHNEQKPEKNTLSKVLNTSIQSEPGSHARSLLFNLEYQNDLSEGLSTSLNADQMTRAGLSPEHSQPNVTSSLPPAMSPVPATDDLDMHRTRRMELSQEAQAPTHSANDQDSLLDDPSNVGMESGGERAIQAPNSYEHTGNAPQPLPGGYSSWEDPSDYDKGMLEADEEEDPLEAITVANTISVGAFKREALRKFKAYRKNVDESSQEQHSNFDAGSTRLLSERSYYTNSKPGGPGAMATATPEESPAGQLPKDLQNTVAKKRNELEKLCEAVDPCRDFQYAIVAMILDKDDINDLVDLEEFVKCYLRLRQPYQDFVKDFFGELCDATFSVVY